ncbi:MAG: cytochrome c family protein [candidate division Zixibacteria bacterium]|nr:cytochrome c family protein [candidate division Zixibacteria bacterium]MDH3939144.1 cytochrome c family protein [candidate division Zixibacteria bacterium]MDH4033468.1 cytochrome c family protein [candidate division Zixibacteria bacterium]
MPQIFPEWINKLPLVVLGLAVLSGGAVVAGIWYFGSPSHTDVGYRPNQPVAYSHKLHAGDLGIDCRYCHVSVESSPVASIPSTQICMNCHALVGVKSDKLKAVRSSWTDGTAIEWVRVHKLPDYAYFDHSLHLRAGVGCSSCHGRVDQMELITQRQSLSMGWCLDCHRDPGPHLRPASEITNMAWQPGPDQMTFAHEMITDKALSPPSDCTGCHR